MRTCKLRVRIFIYGVLSNGTLMCHTYFGMYGLRDGDRTHSITNAEQIDLTADTIADFMHFKLEYNISLVNYTSH